MKLDQPSKLKSDALGLGADVQAYSDPFPGLNVLLDVLIVVDVSEAMGALEAQARAPLARRVAWAASAHSHELGLSGSEATGRMRETTDAVRDHPTDNPAVGPPASTFDDRQLSFARQMLRIRST